MSGIAELALADALECGKALLKFISPNDAGLTRTHQCGFYLPKGAWKMFTPYPPMKGRNDKHWVSITWQNEVQTKSVITWYGKLSRSEYRLTRFGRDFLWLTPDSVGDLVVFIFQSLEAIRAYVLQSEEEMEEVIAGLGVQPFEQWAFYWPGAKEVVDVDECLESKYEDYVRALQDFPEGDDITRRTLDALAFCDSSFKDLHADHALLTAYQKEYALFRKIEKTLLADFFKKPFRDIEHFLKVASQIMNRRKARAGRSLENHVHEILKNAKVPHDMRPRVEGRPDIIIPGKKAYDDRSYPIDKLFVVGVKTTCKDRWAQVLKEGKRARKRYLLTIQPSISAGQLKEMQEAGLILIVPEPLHSGYPRHSIKILKITEFIETVRQTL